jgi:hypothetical protein
MLYLLIGASIFSPVLLCYVIRSLVSSFCKTFDDPIPKVPESKIPLSRTQVW